MRRRDPHGLCLLAANLLLASILPGLLHAAPLPAAEDEAALEAVRQARAATQRGDFPQAVAAWDEAARRFAALGDAPAQADALMREAEGLKALGHYLRAQRALTQALHLAERLEDRRRIALGKAELADAYIVTGPPATASSLLEDALPIAEALQDEALQARVFMTLGNLASSQENHGEALRMYVNGLEHARLAKRRDLAARSGINAALASLRLGEAVQAERHADAAVELLRGGPISHDTAFGLISAGALYCDLAFRRSDHTLPLREKAYRVLRQAMEIAARSRSALAASYAQGHLGRLYEEDGRYDEALNLSRTAILEALRAHAPESLYRWQWQSGRLLDKLGRDEDAVAAYRRSVSTLQSVRQEACVGYGQPRRPLREPLGPLYLEFVDLLLRRAATTEPAAAADPYLLEARSTVELLKVTELRDYYRDDCVDLVQSRTARLDVISQTAMVIYPILLPDRTELLVSTAGGMRRFAVPVGAERITAEVRAFRRNLEKRTTREYLTQARQLYDWLVRPLETELAATRPETLVFVPDGPLRTIPMAALHDGSAFLIDKYAVAITPGLDLADPRPLRREAAKLLAAGVTEAVQGFPPLPAVSSELEAVQRHYGGTTLLNQDFLLARMQQALRGEAFTMVHIASHAVFAADINQTFLLTYDGRMTMDRLDELVGLFRFRDDPLELLVLSACETAAGDDRAALGLAGLAIRAGARSAVATLWQINDPASAVLMDAFYREIQRPAVSRASALRQAQLRLLADWRYQHPGYWSPFVLVNNWL